MEHFEIEDAFRRLTIPQLSFDYKLSNAGLQMDLAHGVGVVRIELILKNNSNVSARFPHISVQMTPPIRLDPNRYSQGISSNFQGGWQNFEAGPDIVINPGVTRSMGFVCFNVPVQNDGGRPRLAGGAALPDKLNVSFGCYDAPQQEERVLLQAEDLIGVVSQPMR